MAKLFLLKPNFKDMKLNDNRPYYCPHCAKIEGILKYYPKLKESLDIIHVDFQRPRKEIVALVGEENQGCPNLIIHKSEVGDQKSFVDQFQTAGDYYFSNSTQIIAEFLAQKYRVGYPHP